jgi:hypothetical protein
VAVKPQQLTELISRLLEKTRQGEISWKSSVSSGSYVARFGGFQVRIEGSRGLGGPSANLAVLRLDGSIVEQVSTNPFATAAEVISGRGPLSQEDRDNLQELYDVVSDRSTDIDELLRAIG